MSMGLSRLRKNYCTRETGGTSEAGKGSRFEVRSSRFSELRTSRRAFLACLALHAPMSCIHIDSIIIKFDSILG